LSSVTSVPVIVTVGKEAEKFFVHGHLLKTYSSYFDKILSFASDVEGFQTVKLQDPDANAFSLFAKWLCSRRLHLLSGPDSSNKVHGDEMMHCYIPSKQLEASAFGDATIDASIRRMKLRNDSPLDFAKWLWPRATKNSVHRKLCQDLAINTWDRKTTLRGLWSDVYPREFVQNVFNEISIKPVRDFKVVSVRDFLNSTGKCAYHEHDLLNQHCYAIAFSK
jgi:hypothetical protein